MITLEEFMKTEKPKRQSKLEPFKSDILTLKKDGYSEASIVKYLEMNGVSVSQRTVNKFIHNHLDSGNIASEAQPAPDKKPYEEKKVPKISTSSSKPRKFDWQTPIDESEIS